MALPLPPTLLGPMFPTRSGSASGNSDLQQQRLPETRALGDHLSPHPVGKTGVKAWVIEESPPAETGHIRREEYERSWKVGREQGHIPNADLRRNPLALERLFTDLDTESDMAKRREERAFGSETKEESGDSEPGPSDPYLRGGA